MKKYALFITLFIFSLQLLAQNTDDLRKEITQIIAAKKADVGVSIIGIEPHDTLSINGAKHYPMVSVFKFHIALTVLTKVDRGELSLHQKILIKKSELLENTWSPFREKYPKGDVYITLKEALQWMIIHSDNNLCDILIRLVGGVEAVEKCIDSPNFIIKLDEEGMHKSFESQMINTTTPVYSTQLLKTFFEKKFLKAKTTKFLYRTMAKTAVGKNRIKGKLPKNTEVAHRTGSSDTTDAGLTGAINDIGIVKLPNGKHIFIAVFVHNTTEKFAIGEEIIANISQATWNYFNKK